LAQADLIAGLLRKTCRACCDIGLFLQCLAARRAMAGSRMMAAAVRVWLCG